MAGPLDRGGEAELRLAEPVVGGTDRVLALLHVQHGGIDGGFDLGDAGHETSTGDRMDFLRESMTFWPVYHAFATPGG
ncbi:hypothetical protein Cco03nite_63320 [Catellatospora coxensis]|uniref:Uncharacterized protein n=1 Tax=Catellatospora coxensis TaxID=310354 RepID=A0A8J3PAA6_9ACTN|nr:hypothetical protein Cco03nite_63320 [Catellatospora coxensis]